MNINPSHHHLVIPSEDRHPFFSYKNKTTDTLASAAGSATEQAAESGLSGKNLRYSADKIYMSMKNQLYLDYNVLAISKAFNNDEDLIHPDTFNFHKGCCYGLSACYILFNILGRSDIFNQLMNVLEQNPFQGWWFYNQSYETLAEAIRDAQNKDKDNQITDNDTQLLLNLRPFLEMLAVLQYPELSELREEVLLPNMQQVISYISDGNLNDSSVMKVSPACIAGLTIDGLKQLLISLSAGISTEVPKRLFSISSSEHTVAVKITSNGYELFDINEENYRKNFPPGTETELASTLQKNINPSSYEKTGSHNDILFEIQELYAPSNHEYLQQDKQNLQSLYSKIPSGHLTNINRICPYSRVTPLYLAILAAGNEALSSILKHEGLDIDAPCDHRIFDNQASLTTALHWAAVIGNTEAINLLLDAGADATILSSDGVTPLHFAIECKQISTIQALLKKVPELVNIPSNRIFPLFIAYNKGNLQTIKILSSAENIDVNQVGPDEKSLLHIACMEGNLEVVKLLLSAKNININQVGPYGMTPLYMACMKGNLEIVKLLLLEKNINVSQPGLLGKSPLHKACMNGDAKMVKTLLSVKNIDVKQTDSSGMSPLHTACITGNIEIAEALLSEKNTDIDLKDNKGKSPAFIAWQKGHTKIFNLLKEREATMES